MHLPNPIQTPLMVFASCVVVSGAALAPFAVSEQQRDATKTQQVGSTGHQTSNEVPTNQIQQRSPCADQSKSRSELARSFDKGRIPSPSEITGSWVSIGNFGQAVIKGKERVDLDCSGLKRENTFEEVLVMKAYVVEPYVIGTPYPEPTTLDRDKAGSLSFLHEFGGDASPVYRCRLTQRGTLACLIDVYRAGSEFKKMQVTRNQLCQKNSEGYCGFPRKDASVVGK
jgi:hypothetical protein